jgi:hypothetical protein
MDDLPMCRSEIALAHRVAIAWFRAEAAGHCNRATRDPDARVSCQYGTKWANEVASTDTIGWYMTGNELCANGGEYTCFGPSSLNDPAYTSDPENEAWIRKKAADRSALPANIEQPPPAGVELGDDDSWPAKFAFAADYADRCAARIWVAKKDGIPFVPLAKQIAASAGGGTASSASASSQSFVKQVPGGEGASSKRFVHNPAADAKSCVKMVQTSTSTDARISGNFHFINECDVGVEIFWCFPRPDGRCANGGTWSVPAGRGWPVLDNEASILWGACRGFGRFVYKDDDRNFTDGTSYYCE